MSIAKSYAKKLVVDIGFLLEGQIVEDLPERLFGNIRLKNLDFNKAQILNLNLKL